MAAQATARRPLPLTVIGGFLGAGKTTLLNHWLRHAGGRRLAVLVNDFGALNIDAGLIEASAGDLVALSNGCVCCQIGDDLGAALIRVLDGPTPFDAVVIEASGVSDPARIGRYGLAGPDLVLDGVIVLVDAAALGEHAADPHLADTLQRQVAGADLLVLNKTDLATPAERAATLACLDRWAAPVPRFETTQARVPLPLLSGSAVALESRPAAPPEACGHADHDGHADHSLHAGDPDHGSVFETWSCRPQRVFAHAALRALLRAMPEGVLRLKGLLRTDTLGWAELQFAGRRGSLSRAAAAPADGAVLVAIGLKDRLPRNALAALFDGTGGAASEGV